ncbi:hypothetical protein L228DRAFT_241724 [Xylona heveae TC161]|uniref:RRM domain-containing protein n=1 Tax=Xylona heveae (strain CBS 132557 / TC161) TaxID=1328760 RepID=A0A164ZTS3_XYLHT|nr:hypothetical protein L228DRAFT_241724 [Xylona heveae TC161]KZF19505.1 hypothetical protein L228DRAFT_241724 [Xylona heveae TC161]
MSDKLSKSLDEIAKEHRVGRGRGRKNTKPKAPAGGITKKTKQAKAPAPAAAPAVLTPASGESKIEVSQLPKDVTEDQIKEYFEKTIGPVKKRPIISYGPNGISRGIASITFSNPRHANTAFERLNGMLVDGKPMKAQAQAAKSLSDRVAQPKNQPKAAAAAPKQAAAGASAAPKATRGRGRGRRGRNTTRPKRKTAEELDAEMVDYFGNENTNGAAAGTEAAPVTNGAAPAPAPAAAGGDTGMEDEIM